MADPAVVFNSPLLPPEPARKVVDQGPTVAAKQRTNQVDAALGQMQQADTDQTTAGDIQIDALRQQAPITNDAANVAAGLEQGKVDAHKQAISAAAPRFAELDSIAATRRQEHEAAGNIEPLLSGWKGVLAGVLQGFATYAHVRAGGTGEAPGVKAWNDVITRDRQMKLDKYKMSGEFLQLAQENIEKAKEALRGKLAQIDNEHIAAGNLLVKKTDAMKSRFKSQEAIAAVEATQAGIRATQAEKLAKMQGEFAATVTRHGQTVTQNTQAPDASGGGTQASALGAARANLIVETVKDVMTSPTMSTQDLQKWRTNKAREAGSKQVPLVEAGIGMITGGRAGIAPAEGETQGMSQSGRQALARNSVLRETVTYLTTGAAATPTEAASKTTQFDIQPSDAPSTVKTKLTNVYRYAKFAATNGAKSMTPGHLQALSELGVALGLEKAPAAPGVPASPGTPTRAKGSDGKTYEFVDGAWQAVD